jgi:hypothetical protein
MLAILFCVVLHLLAVVVVDMHQVCQYLLMGSTVLEIEVKKVT